MSRKYVMSNGASQFAQNGSTQFKVIGSTGSVSFGALYKGNSTASTDLVVSASGLVYSQRVPTNFSETLSYSSLGLSVSTTPAYGITYIDQNTAGGDCSTNVGLLTIAAPIIGVRKTIVLKSTVASSNTLALLLSTNVGVLTSTGTTNSFINFSSLATMTQSITLVGLSTTLWGVIGTESTCGDFDAVAGGIRSSNAVRAEV